MTDTVHKLEPGTIDLDEDDLFDKFHVDPSSQRGENFRQIINQARRVGNPKAIYTVSYITNKGENTVEIDDVEFTSKVLRDQLDKAERAFPFIATCGRELDTIDLDEGSQLEALFLEEIKARALTTARSSLYQTIKEGHQVKDFSYMEPGSGGEGVWPIGEQEKLFELFKGEERSIGVELTDSFLMVPNKSVSGVIYQTELHFESCQLCRKDNCPAREADYDPQLAEKYELG